MSGAMDPSIIMRNDVPDVASNYLRAMQIRTMRDEAEQQNALRQATQQYGGAAVMGDQNALRGLAAVDPTMAMGLRGDQQTMDLRTRADGRDERSTASGIQVDQARVEQIRQQTRMAAAQQAMSVSEAERLAGAAEARAQGDALMLAFRGGEEEWRRVAPEVLGQDVGFADAPYAIAALRGGIEGLEAPETELMTVPAGNSVIDKANPNQGAVFTAPDAPKPTPDILNFEYGQKNPEFAAGLNAPDPAARAGQTEGLRKEYNALAKDFRSVHDAYARIEATTGESPQADMSLIFQFMKMLDPGSTVREGEYASAEQTRGLPDTVAALYNKALTGETLTPQQRDEFRGQARNLYERAASDNKSVGDQYRSLAEQNKLDPNQVVLPYGGAMAPGEDAPAADESIDDIAKRWAN